ncbi:Aste57867_22531 [Aphanomyces stellatus]|uniref:Aste57867_22531 protein n=1 Tax=Aphanomyces stellatus TaxID=120398 RepID=A0A485LLN0_9STRA|nr:hypothetical protein As57867_022461 [Aphanomyces stellatus]VFT99191.1 Aste57867_22531 [Aphanomyces stellatus]
MTEYLTPYDDAVNLGDLPTNLALYLRNTVWYVTSAVIVVAGLVAVYVILSRGHIKVLNPLELQRVGAIVWIADHCSLCLVFNESTSYFQVLRDPWYKTLLAANEVSRLVAIVNDIAMAFTREYTVYYATINSVLFWLVIVALSVASPMSHSVTIDMQCQLAQVDFQIVCTSGVVTSGHVSRYLFYTSTWVVDNIYYMDRMSAALNGLLTLRYDQTIYGLDTKLWRTFCIDVPAKGFAPTHHPLAEAAKFAIPLTATP